MANQLLDIIKQLVMSFLSNGVEGKIEASVSIPLEVPKEEKEEPVETDWTKVSVMLSDHFSVGEMVALHSWNRLATEDDGLTDEVKANLLKLCSIMEKVRMLLGCGINVHCGFRSVKYNQEVLHSIPHDVHSMGMAIDFDCNQTMTIEQTKEKIRPHLEELDIRMEGGTTTWIHLDTHIVGPSGREFKA